jgi:iron complex outermembrane receptor protein
MSIASNRARLMASSVLFGATLAACLAAPEFAAAQSQPAAQASEVGEVVVTGSRIRRVQTDTDAPVAVVGQQDILDRGYAQVGEAVAKNTAVAPLFANTAGSGTASGDGRQYPNLFNLGAGRTLSLINGRRTAPSSTGFGTGVGNGDRVTDTNIVPTGLLERVDIVQAGGAAVYGSDAIAGVINYVLKQNFEGLVVDLQGGNTYDSTYEKYAARVTAGKNFADGRGNIAMNAEWNKTGSILYGERKITSPVCRTLANPYNVSTTDGIAAVTPVCDPHFWYFNQQGVISNVNASNANAKPNLQFSKDGQSVIAYNPGTPYKPPFPCAAPFCSGGDGYAYNGLAAYVSAVENLSLTTIGHYDLTDHMKISGELLYARSEGRDPLGSQASQAALGGAGSGAAISFTRDNAFLTPAAVASLSAAYPTFATGSPIFLSKGFDDIYPTREFVYTTDTYRGVVSLDGDFDALDRNFYYNAFYSRSVVKGKTNAYGRYEAHFRNAIDAVKNASGQIVCRINADAITTNDDSTCVPLNAFGIGNITDAARAYSVVANDTLYTNTQDDFLATLGGEVFNLPAGAVKFNVGYEHRKETTKNSPSTAAQLGLLGTTASPPTSGEFSTNEFSGELLVPLIGGDFKLPFVEELELSAQGRIVDNSLAGRENVWGAGLRWNIGYGLTLRGSLSRNFRAPTLQQLTAPQTTVLGGGIQDPCDQRVINAGPAPATRVANCQALFAKNPSWGALSAFQDPAFNFDRANITSGGNPNLENEISDTKTFGFAWTPRYVPGNLTVVADHIIVDLKNGLTAFTPTNFSQGCFDASPMPADLCSTFARDPATGYIVSALNVTFNAAKVLYKGDVINVNYRFPVAWVLPMFDDPGSLEISAETTHNDTLKQVVAGVTTNMAGTTVSPRWVTRGEVRYHRGPLTASYEIYYLPETKQTVDATIETSPYPIVKSNMRHSISASYDFMDRYQVRAGISNITNRQVSFPTFNYGDQIGRSYFVGLRATF